MIVARARMKKHCSQCLTKWSLYTAQIQQIPTSIDDAKANLVTCRSWFFFFLMLLLLSWLFLRVSENRHLIFYGGITDSCSKIGTTTHPQLSVVTRGRLTLDVLSLMMLLRVAHETFCVCFAYFFALSRKIARYIAHS